MRNAGMLVLTTFAVLIAIPALIATEVPTVKAPNTLTASEKAAGWRLVWDGKTTDGWHSAKTGAFPTSGWEIADGVLTVHETNDLDSAGGGNIITRERFSSFELRVDFKITPGANSGIKYFVQSNLDPENKTGATAPPIATTGAIVVSASGSPGAPAPLGG